MKKILVLAFILIAAFFIDRMNVLPEYFEYVVELCCINIMLACSLNLVNGYLGAFSTGHAGFMAIGAYISSIFTLKVFTGGALFYISILAGGVAAGLVSIVIGFASFKSRGNHIAMVTMAFVMIIKSLFENMESLGGARGLVGIPSYATFFSVAAISLFSLLIIRTMVMSNYGRRIVAVREDEIAAKHVGLDVYAIKIQVFAVAAFFAGIAGGLFANMIGFINPRTFSIQKSIDVLLMVYMISEGTILGPVIGAIVYTVAVEAMRPLGVYRWVIYPLGLVILMLMRAKNAKVGSIR